MTENFRNLGIIPSRYASSRLPGKPLLDINGKSMIRRVYEQAKEANCLNRVVVATDDHRIYDHVLEFGGEAVMTSEDIQTGTDRCFAAYREIGETYDFVVNIQGDEPFIRPDQINLLAELFSEETEIVTLVRKIDDEAVLFDPNNVRVVFNEKREALYFSRSVIPYLRDVPKEKWLENQDFYQHIGLYAYRADMLEKIAGMEQSNLELAERLEQLRWLEKGITIKVNITPHATLGIDTPEDLEKARLRG